MLTDSLTQPQNRMPECLTSLAFDLDSQMTSKKDFDKSSRLKLILHKSEEITAFRTYFLNYLLSSLTFIALK